MQDFKLEINSSNIYDLVIGVDGQLEGVNDFTTAITTSLLSDARAGASQVSVPQYRRGWIGNVVSPIEGRQYGSLLWLIEQSRLTQSTLNFAIDYARSSLSWIVEQGIAANIEVTGRISSASGITLNIVVTSLSGQTETHYVNMWENTKNAN